ncbi:Nitrate reductase gamma subunit [Desulfosarcina cetonica]|uniref:TmcC family electron transfer complex membrane anchor subunit n=1 Tax=Desulfosarcina cetonica TaxID=90730 RepID=UPI0006D1973A|nr:nitrate reductase [Desulfosarcina cetonica]VTR68712.1 Nitrate reductase gamma subunit [Desulfosarcina cetonica]
MHSFYNFVSGPLAWIAFLLFIGGSIFRIGRMLVLVAQKEPFIFTYMSWRYSFRSILHWIVPFATVNWRRQPVLTVVTFAFHLCLLAVPVFLLAHAVLWEDSFGIRWWSLPDTLADTLTVIVILGAVFFLVRRITRPEVRFVTSASDYVILAIVSAPFITGFLAYHQWFAYPLMMGLHVLAGDIMLAAIPFTRLSHMIFSPFTRAYMGSEFGKVRHARDW